MSELKLDKYTRDVMMQVVKGAIGEVETDLFDSLRQFKGTDRTVLLSRLDVLTDLTDKVVAKLS